MTSRGLAAGASARPFPWTALDSTTHVAIHAHRALRSFAEHQDAESIARALEAVVGTRVDIRRRRVDVTSVEASSLRALPDAVAVALDDAEIAARSDHGNARTSPRLLLEVEPALATAVVAHALRRPAPRLPLTTPSTRIAGAFAAVVASSLRRANASRPLRVLAAGAAPEIWRGARAEDGLVVATVTVVLGDDAFLARIATTRTALDALPTPTHERAGTGDGLALRALGDVCLRVPVVLAASFVSRDELAQLAVGDAWMPVRGRTGIAGPVLLAAASSDRGARADLGDDGRVVVREGSEDLSMAGDNVVVENAAEAPVVVRVEIGSVELPARAWAAVVPGDVIALAHRVADPVVLRANGVEVARGELVEIEGEVGVRILNLVGGTR
jgi:flagellar motor switch/type III secretory pathway protein FliN